MISNPFIDMISNPFIAILLPFMGCAVVLLLLARSQRRQEHRGRNLIIATLLVTLMAGSSVAATFGAVTEGPRVGLPVPAPTVYGSPTPKQSLTATPSPSVSTPTPVLPPYNVIPGLTRLENTPEDFQGGTVWKVGTYGVEILLGNGTITTISVRGVSSTIATCNAPKPLHFRMWQDPPIVKHQKYRDFTLAISSSSPNRSINVIGTIETYAGSPQQFGFSTATPFRTQLDVGNTVNVDVNMVLDPTSPYCGSGPVQVVLFDTWTWL